jgi:hypothetical protein
MWPSEIAPPIAFAEDATLRAAHSSVMDVDGVEDRLASTWAHAAIQAIQIGSDSNIRIGAYWSRTLQRATVYHSEPIDLPPWGHYSEELGTDALEFARVHTPTMMPLASSEVYSRVANALRIYHGALEINNPDLALLGFVGAIESLFSIATQELSFRLSLLLAKFLGDTADAQRDIFESVRGLYVIRSKISHGDKIAETEEAAAIQVVERWTPEAEEIARLALKRILERNLIGIFNDRQKHEALLTNLLFVPTLSDALGGNAIV